MFAVWLAGYYALHADTYVPFDQFANPKSPAETPDSDSLENIVISNTTQVPKVGDYLVYDLKNAKYLIVSDPLGKGRVCVQKGDHSETNPRTLYGMVTVLGDPRNATDTHTFIYDGLGNIIGELQIGVQASFQALTAPAYPDAVACAEN